MCAKHLEARVSSLEDKVFGDLDKNGQYTKATDVILGFNSRLGNVLGDYERAVMIMKRLEELESYLDPLYGLHQTTPATRAAELMANQQQLRQLCQQLQRLQQLQPLLDSQNLQDAEVLRGRLEAAAQRHLEQTRRQAALAARARQLAHHYRAAAATTAAALLRAEARVAAAERA